MSEEKISDNSADRCGALQSRWRSAKRQCAVITTNGRETLRSRCRQLPIIARPRDRGEACCSSICCRTRTARILDAGCGTGLVGAELARLGYTRIDGFDLSASMTARAAETAAYRDLRGGVDMMRLDEHYAAEGYDSVLSVGVFTLGHVTPEALHELMRVLRRDGLLLVTTRTQYYEQTNFQQIVDALCADGAAELLQLLRDAPYNNDGAGHYWVLRKTA